MYTGPLRGEPLAIELHNTIYIADGRACDGLEDADAWLDALAGRLPDVPGEWPAAEELATLREPVRAALRSAVDGVPAEPAVLDAINRAAARAPRSPVAVLSGDAVKAAIDHHGVRRADVVIAALAADAIELLTGAHRQDLRACHAPACVLLFLKDHPRRAWCSNACGNRARQARHYRRSRA